MAIQGDLAQILSGMAIPIPECNIIITQPTIRNICAFGEDNFFMGIQLFTETERITMPVREGNSRLAMLSDFQLLLVILEEDKQTKDAVQQFFELIFPTYRIRFDPGSVCFLKEDSERIVGQLNPMNVEAFQVMLQQLFLPYGSKQEEDYKPVNEKAAEIAEKLKRGNRIRQQMKAEQEKSSSSVFGHYISILSVGLGMDINILFQYTPFQLYDSFIRYQYKLNNELYQRLITVPFADTSKITEPDSWMDNIYK